MRYLFYYYNEYGSLIFRYTKDGARRHQTYIGYTLREAIQKFRRDNNLRYKHLIIQKL